MTFAFVASGLLSFVGETACGAPSFPGAAGAPSVLAYAFKGLISFFSLVPFSSSLTSWLLPVGGFAVTSFFSSFFRSFCAAAGAGFSSTITVFALLGGYAPSGGCVTVLADPSTFCVGFGATGGSAGLDDLVVVAGAGAG